MRGGLIERGFNRLLKYEQVFYGDIICILSYSSVIFISVYSTLTFELDFDLVCCLTNEHHEYHKVYAHYEDKLCLSLSTFNRDV